MVDEAAPLFRGVQHAAYTVTSVNEAVAFLREAMDCEELFREDPAIVDDPATAAAMNIPVGTRLVACAILACGGGCNVELFEFRTRERSEVVPHGADISGRHLALEVSNIVAAARRLEAAGATLCGSPDLIPSGPWDGLQWLFATTPFGLQIELMQFPAHGCGYDRHARRGLYHPRIDGDTASHEARNQTNAS